MAITNRGHRAFEWTEIDAIRARYERGESQGSLARDFGVTINTIGRIVRGETYVNNSRTRIEQPQATRHQLDLNDPESIMASAKRIIANAEALGPLAQPREARPLTLAEKRQAEFERIFREVGYREAQEYTQECLREDLAAAGKKPIETPPIRGGFGMAIPAADDPPDELPQGLLDNLPPKA